MTRTTSAQAEEQDIALVPEPRHERPASGERPAWGKRGHAPRTRNPDTTRIFIGAGREDSLRPGDLVGAITNEAGVSGSTIGAIRITDRFSLVEVSAERADQIIQALRGTTLRGKKVTVRRDRES